MPGTSFTWHENAYSSKPQQATFDLIAPVADRMETDGWQQVEPFPGVDKVVVLEHDGYRATIGGDREVVEGDGAKVSVEVASTCLGAPEELGE